MSEWTWALFLGSGVVSFVVAFVVAYAAGCWYGRRKR